MHFHIALDPERARRGAALYHRFARCAEPQPAFIDFYPADGLFRCLYYQFILAELDVIVADDGEAQAEKSGTLVRFPVPAAAATSALLALLEDKRFVRLALRVRAGHRYLPDENVVHYSADAVAAIEQMRDMIAEYFTEPTANLVQLLTPADLIRDNGAITPATSDTELDAWADTYAALAWVMYRCAFECDEDVLTHLRALRAQHTSNA